MKRTALLALVPLSLLTAGCVAEPEGFYCTTENIVVSVLVRTPDGAPADSVEITVQNARTGKTYEMPENDHPYTPGVYTVFTDRYHREISPRGEPIRVTGRKGALGFTADYRIAGGDCHIDKLAGPDSVVIR